MANTTTAATITATWGITESLPDNKGIIITDWDGNEEALIENLKDEKGAVVLRQHYDTKYTVKCSFHIKTTTGKVPAIGAKVTVNSIDYKVISVNLTQTNQGWEKYAVTLEAYKAPA